MMPIQAVLACMQTATQYNRQQQEKKNKKKDKDKENKENFAETLDKELKR